MSPSQWKGAVSLVAPRSGGVRRGPVPAKVHTRPSSPPSGWHDAQAMPAGVPA